MVLEPVDRRVEATVIGALQLVGDVEIDRERVAVAFFWQSHLQLRRAHRFVLVLLACDDVAQRKAEAGNGLIRRDGESLPEVAFRDLVDELVGFVGRAI